MSSPRPTDPKSPDRADAVRSRVVVLLLLAAAMLSGFAATQPAASGLALLALACAPAIFAVPPRGRRTLGLATAGVAVLVGVVGTLGDDVLAWVSVASLVLAGLVIAWRGRSWAALGSRFSGRHGSGAADPASEPTSDPASRWRDLDRGKDPTESDLGRPDEPGEPPRV